ncbi:MAG: thioredoxin family protein [Rubrivivax sp.]|nr:thioredoxin family protein [Rubrivivax sp.]
MSVRPLVLAGAAAVAVAIGLGFALVRNTGPMTPAATTTVSTATPANDAADAADTVQLALRAGKPTVAEFGANACASCREMKPVLEAVRREHGERFTVVEVDLIKQREVAYIQRYRIQLMPTQVFFDAQGNETGRNVGKLSAEDIVARLQGGGS